MQSKKTRIKNPILLETILEGQETFSKTKNRRPQIKIFDSEKLRFFRK